MLWSAPPPFGVAITSAGLVIVLRPKNQISGKGKTRPLENGRSLSPGYFVVNLASPLAPLARLAPFTAQWIVILRLISFRWKPASGAVASDAGTSIHFRDTLCFSFEGHSAQPVLEYRIRLRTANKAFGREPNARLVSSYFLLANIGFSQISFRLFARESRSAYYVF